MLCLKLIPFERVLQTIMVRQQGSQNGILEKYHSRSDSILYGIVSLGHPFAGGTESTSVVLNNETFGNGALRPLAACEEFECYVSVNSPNVRCAIVSIAEASVFPCRIMRD